MKPCTDHKPISQSFELLIERLLLPVFVEIANLVNYFLAFLDDAGVDIGHAGLEWKGGWWTLMVVEVEW